MPEQEDAAQNQKTLCERAAKALQDYVEAKHPQGIVFRCGWCGKDAFVLRHRLTWKLSVATAAYDAFAYGMVLPAGDAAVFAHETLARLVTKDALHLVSPAGCKVCVYRSNEQTEWRHYKKDDCAGIPKRCYPFVTHGALSSSPPQCMEFCNGQLCRALVDEEQFINAPIASVTVRQESGNLSKQPQWFRVWVLHPNARVRWRSRQEALTATVMGCKPRMVVGPTMRCGLHQMLLPTAHVRQSVAASSNAPMLPLQYKDVANTLMEAARQENGRVDGWKKRKPDTVAQSEPTPPFATWMDEKWEPLSESQVQHRALPLLKFSNANPCNSEYPFRWCACELCELVRNKACEHT
jgi:hypothetical protein